MRATAKRSPCVPGDIDILYNRSTSLWALRRFEETILDCEQVLKSDPQFKYARGNLLHSRLQCCDWRGLEEEKATIASGLKAGLRVLRPLQNVAISGSGEALLQSSRIWTAHECPPSEKPLWRGERYRHDRIRIAYVSADFRLHPVATLGAGVFEHHDRSRFETIAISLGADDGMGMRERMQNAFERFIDVRNQSDAEIAKLLRDMEIDIAVDMMGFTENALTAIFARRPAGLQVNYLGYPGTMGAPYMDYILADRIVIPESHQTDYDEKIVYLPDTYMPNDGTRRIAERTPSRAEAGLPDAGFVFCTFNNLYKITPEMFALWMRLMARVEGQRALAIASQPCGRSQSQAGGRSPGNLRRTDHIRALRQRPRRASCPPAACGPVSRYPALQCARHDMRRVMGGSSRGHADRNEFCGSRRHQPSFGHWACRS